MSGITEIIDMSISEFYSKRNIKLRIVIAFILTILDCVVVPFIIRIPLVSDYKDDGILIGTVIEIEKDCKLYDVDTRALHVILDDGRHVIVKDNDENNVHKVCDRVCVYIDRTTEVYELSNRKPTINRYELEMLVFIVTMIYIMFMTVLCSSCGLCVSIIVILIQILFIIAMEVL